MSENNHSSNWNQNDTAVQEAGPKLKKPPMYQVVLLNDDFTPMEFVVELLEKIFFYSRSDATRIMLQIHNKGREVCGIYPEDVAITKTDLVNRYSRDHQHPLRCQFEPCDQEES